MVTELEYADCKPLTSWAFIRYCAEFGPLPALLILKSINEDVLPFVVAICDQAVQLPVPVLSILLSIRYAVPVFPKTSGSLFNYQESNG
ncbi:MAG: hypothetical protein HXY50_01000 [Ignavibacteriaceae bacterium]|nr:hypothetical protein [Ignavibacteriaceae bacterium]